MLILVLLILMSDGYDNISNINNGYDKRLLINVITTRTSYTTNEDYNKQNIKKSQ